MTEPILAAYIQGGATVLAAVLVPVLTVLLARWLPSSPPVPALPSLCITRVTCITGSNSSTRIISSPGSLSIIDALIS